MVNTIECGKLESRILRYLALHPDSLIQPIEKGLESYYKNVHDDVLNLCKKGYVELGKPVKTKRNATQKGYRLSRDGLLYVFSHENIDVQTVLHLYGEGNEFLKEYQRLYKVMPNKNLLKALIRTASSFALKYDNVDAVMNDPKHLLKATADLEDVYGNRPDDEKACLQSLANSFDAQIKKDPELNRIYEKRKRVLKRLAKTKVK
jgi:hypothetical protein